MLFLKRLRDTDNVKMVYAKWPSWYDCQVWTDETGDHLYIYDVSQWLVYDWVSTPWMVFDMANWKNLTDETVWYYETNDPKDLYNWDHLDWAYYQFVNYDGQVLQSGTVDEWETPEYTWDTPTKPDSAAETFTFSWWNPAVGPITKRTTYTAQYEASPRNYTVTIGVSPSWAGTVDTQQVTVAYGTEISNVGNELIIWSNTITATAWSGYEFSSWGTLPATVTENLTITATFEAIPVSYTLTFTPRDEGNNTQWGGSINPTSYTVTQDWLYIWFNSSYTDNLRIVTDPADATTTTIDMIVPTPDTDYNNAGWYYYNETQQDWAYLERESGWVLISWDMQIRWYFNK